MRFILFSIFGASVMIPMGYIKFIFLSFPCIAVNIFIQPITCEYKYFVVIVQFVRFGYFGGFLLDYSVCHRR